MGSMKTSFFKRKPDLHAATIEYFEAGIHWLYLLILTSASLLCCTGTRTSN